MQFDKPKQMRTDLPGAEANGAARKRGEGSRKLKLGEGPCTTEEAGQEKCHGSCVTAPSALA